jgi:hypothetical protein
MGETRGAYRFWWESQKEGDHSEHLYVGGRINIRIDLREI